MVENFDEIYSVVHVSLLLFHLSDQELVHLTDQVFFPLTDQVFLHHSVQGLVHLTARCYFPSHMEENFTMMEVLAFVAFLRPYP